MQLHEVRSTCSLNNVNMMAEDVALLICSGIADYFAFKLTESERGDKLGLYGFGPTVCQFLRGTFGSY